MSITSRINEMSSHIEQAYDELQGLGADLTNVNKNIENISMVLDDIYDSMPQVSGEGTSLTLDNTRVGKIKSTLKGNTSQTTYSGKNLFNIDGKYETGTGITYTKNDDGSYTLNGTANGNNFLRGLCYLNEQHTISYTSDTANSNVILRTRTGTPSAQTGIQDQLAVSSTSGNLTSSKQFDFVEISIVSGTTLNNFKIYIQLEKGSSVTSFEPYVGGTPSPNPSYPQPVNVVSGDNTIKVEGKNLANITDIAEKTTNGITYKVENGVLYLSGTASANTTIVLTFDKIDELGTYYIVNTLFNENPTIPNNTDWCGSSYWMFSGWREGTFSLTSGKYLSQIRLIITSGQSFNNMVYRPIITKGSTATTYEPYQGNTYNIDLPESMELCKIGNYQDYFYKDSGKWYLHKEIGKVVLNGSESWSKGASRPFYTLSINDLLRLQSAGNNATLFCNYLSPSTPATIWGNNINGITNLDDSNAIRIRIQDDPYTITTFKEWLNDVKPVVYYVLATPTNTEVTYEPLITQLNLLEKAMSKDGQTNISQVNNDLPFIISASALKEWQESTSLNSTLSMVNPLSLGNTLNTQENNIQPIEVDNIEPLEEEENEES